MNDAMRWADIAQDYVSALAWPGVVALALFLFRQQIAALINRIQRFKTPGGGEFDTPTQPPPPPPPEGHPPDSGVPPSGEAAQAVEQLGPYVYYWYYEKMYRLLYGTQIEILQAVNQRGTEGSHFQELFEFHHKHLSQIQALMPSHEYSWDKYMGFLLSTKLIELQDDRYYITELGKSFLQWMVAEGVPLKAF